MNQMEMEKVAAGKWGCVGSARFHLIVTREMKMMNSNQEVVHVIYFDYFIYINIRMVYNY